MGLGITPWLRPDELHGLLSIDLATTVGPQESRQPLPRLDTQVHAPCKPRVGP